MRTDTPNPSPEKAPVPAHPLTRNLREMEDSNWFYQWYSGDRPVREQRATYFEKLALFNSGTIALTITAVLGQVHDRITHHYTLRAALCSLVAAMVLLIVRNFVWTNHESTIISMGLRLMLENHKDAIKTAKEADNLAGLAGKLGMAGVGFTALGLLLLLVVVLPIV